MPSPIPDPAPRADLETLDYIKAMLGQLRGMAQARNFNMLAYMIEMAYIEATDMVVGTRPMSEQKSERIAEQRYKTS